MQNESSRKILGAFVIGGAIVAGSYTLANFTKPVQVNQQANVSAVQETAPPRVAIEVVDADNNGIEDWRDSFVTTEPIIIEDSPAANYTPPDTLTGRTGINFMRDILSSKIYAGVARTEGEIIDDTTKILELETSYKLYDLNDVEIIRSYSDNDIKNYANAMAGVILENDLEGYENELSIFNRVVNYGEKERISELEVISGAYATMRDESLTIPVPAIFVKEHLDLINTYHAVAKDIEAMTMTFEDPMVTLLRLRRYEDDVLGLQYALQYMYIALNQHSVLFTEDDTALLFSSFAPQGRI